MRPAARTAPASWGHQRLGRYVSFSYVLRVLPSFIRAIVACKQTGDFVPALSNDNIYRLNILRRYSSALYYFTV